MRHFSPCSKHICEPETPAALKNAALLHMPEIAPLIAGRVICVDVPHGRPGKHSLNQANSTAAESEDSDE